MAQDRHRWLRWLLATLGVAVVAGLLAARPLLGWGLQRWAEQQGVTLQFERLGLEPGALVLEGVQLQVQALPMLHFASSRAMFHVKQTTPERLHLEAPRVTFTGTPQEAQQHLGRWLQGLRLPPGLGLSASSLTLVARTPGAPTPWLALEGASASSLPGGGHRLSWNQLQAHTTRFPSGQLFVTPAEGGYELSLLEPPSSLPFRLFLHPQPQPSLLLQIRRFPLRTLADLGLQVPPDLQRVELEGSLESSLTLGEPMLGKLHLEAHGYTPPHPPEVSALVKGDRTVVNAELSYQPESLGKGSLALAPLVVTSGRLQLKGSGSAAVEQDHLTFKGTLNGGLPCKDVARSAARADLGDLLGGFAGGLAGGLAGTIQLSVQMEVDSRNLKAASLRTGITPRCSLSLPF